MWITRVLSSITFLWAIIFSIPLAFDVGGRTCGLAYSLSISSLYFISSLLRVLTPEENSKFRRSLIILASWTQWLFLPALLIWSLNRFSVDSEQKGGWAARAFGVQRAPEILRDGFKEWLFGREGVLEDLTIGGWDRFLRWSSPIFQLCEGFCSLLVIQATGQVSKYLVNKGRSDTWLIALLVASASVISSAGYFLWRIARFPDLDSADALLIGFTVACAVFLGVWGIISGRGNAVESSLLFAYVVLCIYQIFTDYQPSYPLMAPQHAASPSDIPPLPPIIMASYSTLIYALSTLPGILHSAFNFMIAALYTITPSVIISLAYRIFVLFASTRIIPAVRESGARSLEQEPSLDDRDGAGRILGLLSWFTPSILISVYTSLLMQHFASTVSAEAGGGWWTSQAGGIEGGKVWRWVNVVGTMLMYAIELKLSEQDYDGGLTGHWKSD